MTYIHMIYYESIVSVQTFYHIMNSQAVLACQRAVLSQISDRLDPLKTTHVDDYLYVMKDMMEHMTIGIMDRYDHFIGKLLSYVPFLK